ncbi:MAG: biopolymer transporter ExbD, partial [Myxococcales bacterium]|nr:biopolymer transporter ExbD [Myxococcales bacterium]
SSAGCIQRTACAPLPDEPPPAEVPVASSANKPVAAIPFDLPRASEFAAPPVLPPASHQNVEEIATLATVDLAADGTLRFNGEKLSQPDELLVFAKRAHDADPNIRAVVRADKSASWGLVVRAMDVLKQAGIARLAFAVDASKP